MIEKVKQRLAGLNYVIDLSNKQGCSVQLKQRNQQEMFVDRIEFYFSKFSKTSEFRYNICPSINKSISDLDVFDFSLDGFMIVDLFSILLDHIDITKSNEMIVILNESQLMSEADDDNKDIECENWAWDFIENYFRGLHERGNELEPQRLYYIEEGQLHIHFKLKSV